MKDKTFGFTLAETLITLGIIGVVAAMTIPNLITAHQKKVTVTKLQKAISILNQAYRLSYEDLGEPDNAFNMGSEMYFKTYWNPYIKGAELCNNSRCMYKKGVSSPNGDSQGMGGDYSGNILLPFYTMDGILYIVFTGATSGNISVSSSIIAVDINGNEKGPNRFGRDFFYLTRLENGKGVVPYGYNLSDSALKSECSNSGTGWYCAERIKRAGWQIDDSYPWK